MTTESHIIGPVDVAPLRETEPKLNDLQKFAVEANYVRGFFNNCVVASKAELPWLRQKEDERRKRENDVSRPLKNKDLKKRFMYGMFDAYVAKKAEKIDSNTVMQGSAIDKFRSQYGDMADYYLGHVEKVTKKLEVERTEALEHPEKIEPYDILLATRRAKRFRASLPKEIQDVFSETSGVPKDKLAKRISQKVSTILLTTASAYGVDTAALVSGSAGVAAHIPVLETMPGWGLLIFDIASYGGLGWGIWQSVKANKRLSKETGLSTNVGFAAGDLTAQLTGADEQKSERLAVKGQIAGEIAKELPWIVGLGIACAGGVLSLRETGIFVLCGNSGAMAYEASTAFGINKALNVRRKIYNQRHPFQEPGRHRADKIN